MRQVRVANVQPLRMAHLAPFEGQRDHGEARKLMEQNVEMACRLLDQAGRAGCDICCYPEDLQGIAHYGFFLDDPELFSGLVEKVPGPTTERVAEVARRHAMHVVFGQFEREGNELYNAAVLVGRRGEVLGKYRKVHLPASERWMITPGSDYPAFQTDFGTVGIMICYDLLFPEVARCLSLNGAELLFNPTMAYDVTGQCEDNGVLRVRMRALDSFAPVVVSLCRSGSIIVGSDGSILAQARADVEEIITATIDLDATPVDHSFWEAITGTADMKARLIQERKPATYAGLAAASAPVLARYATDRLRSSPHEIMDAYEVIRRQWSGNPGR